MSPPNESEREFDAIVYDLDGTLVDLNVNWDRVADEVCALLRDADVDWASVSTETAADVNEDADLDHVDLWQMIDLGAAVGLEDEVEATIAAHEREGARTSARLPLADEIAEHDVPVGVCSLNCEEACHIALETHDLTEYVDAVVGRDTVATRKPDPEPLLETVRRLSAEPGRALFVGDSESDEITATHAGTAFEYV